jgi:hypothetical protein
MSRQATARATAGLDPALRLNNRNAFKTPDRQLGETTIRGQEDTAAGAKVVDADAYLSIRHVAANMCFIATGENSAEATTVLTVYMADSHGRATSVPRMPRSLRSNRTGLTLRLSPMEPAVRARRILTNGLRQGSWPSHRIRICRHPLVTECHGLTSTGIRSCALGSAV